MFATLTLRAVDVPTAKLVKRELQDTGQYQACFVENCAGFTDIFEQMFLNLSPLAAHLNESLCSLRFATKASTINKVPEWRGANALLMLFVGIGQQHTNRDCKEASQEYIVNPVSQSGLSGLLFLFFCYSLVLVCPAFRWLSMFPFVIYDHCFLLSPT
jgi:hypothetical protein